MKRESTRDASVLDAPHAHSVAGASIPTALKTVRDTPVRLFHFALIGLLPLAWWTYEIDRVDLHIQVGYVILTLLFWRLMWGFTGSETARFSTMVRAVHGLPEQLRTMGKRGGEHPAGYGALGSLAIIGFLSLLTVQALLGLFSQDNPQMTGPLANYVPAEVSKAITDWHDWIFFSVIVPVVVIHAAAALYHHVWKRDPIVSAMVTGKKPVAGPAPALGSPRMALTCLVIAAGTVAAIAMLRI